MNSFHALKFLHFVNKDLIFVNTNYKMIIRPLRHNLIKHLIT